MPKFDFCIPTPGKTVPCAPEWFHEIKYDGYRLRVERDGDSVRLVTRGGYDWTKRFPWIAEAALKNRRRQFVIDGEAVVLGVMASPISTRCTRASRITTSSSVPSMSWRSTATTCATCRSRCVRPSWIDCSEVGRMASLSAIRARCDWTWPIPRSLRHGPRGPCVEAQRPPLSRWPVTSLDQGEEPLTSRV